MANDWKRIGRVHYRSLGKVAGADCYEIECDECGAYDSCIAIDGNIRDAIREYHEQYCVISRD